MGPNKKPSIFFFNDLVRTIREIEGYMYKEGAPIDKDDHMMENLYRLALLETKWRPNIGARVGGETKKAAGWMVA